MSFQFYHYIFSYIILKPIPLNTNLAMLLPQTTTMLVLLNIFEFWYSKCSIEGSLDIRTKGVFFVLKVFGVGSVA